jgi:hypothetical protein
LEEGWLPPCWPPREPPLVKPGKDGWPLWGALKRWAGRKLESAGIGIPDSNPDSYEEEESAWGLLDGNAARAG